MSSLRRLFPALSAALLLAGCASQPPATTLKTFPADVAQASAQPSRPYRDGAPLRLPTETEMRDAMPQSEPLARYGNHTPYDVLGRRYYLMPTAKGYTEYGTASWYGVKFQGQPTSTLEPYDLFSMTAAHKYLPLPTYVRVTNLDNQRSVVVRVNDRGPFVDDRVIDMSYAAAVKLGYANKGTARVKVEAITFPDTPTVAGDTRPYRGKAAPTGGTAVASTTAARPAVASLSSQGKPSASDGGKQIFLQAGAFSDQRAAANLQSRLTGVTRVPIRIASNEDTRFRVHVGPFDSEDAAREEQSRIRESQIADPLLIRR
jgi:rare lipoprotein A